MSIISGDGLTLETEMIVDSWDDLINHYSDGTKYIALDPNNKDKVIDINKFTPGTHGIAYTGRAFITSNCTWENFNGNNWTIKNLWYQGGTMIVGRKAKSLTINNLNMLNWFHYNTSNANFIYMDNSSTSTTSDDTQLPYIFNNCKISILCTSSNEYFFFNRHSTKGSSFIANSLKLLTLNNCSINIRSTANDFHLTTESKNGILHSGNSSEQKSRFEFNNTNFKINSYYSSYIFDLEINNRNFPYLSNYFNFCKFTIKNNGKLFYCTFSTNLNPNKSITINFLHCFFQIKNKDTTDTYQINDKAKGIINKDYSEGYSETLGTNCALLTKEQILDANYLISIGFPVMNPDGEPEESEV